MIFKDITIAKLPFWQFNTVRVIEHYRESFGTITFLLITLLLSIGASEVSVARPTLLF